MDVFDAVRTLLAVRTFQERPVPEDAVLRILEAGRLTASGLNEQPWHFVVVRDRETLRQIGASMPTAPYIAQAQLAIVVAVDRIPAGVSDASRAIQSMLLTAWSEGIAGNWSGFGALAEVGALVGIPTEVDVLAVLPFGFPADAIGRGKKNRKPLDQVAYRERWGIPYR
jgi:nitroreductase